MDEEDFLPALSSLSNKYGSVNKHTEEDPQDVQGIADLKTLTVLAVGNVVIVTLPCRTILTKPAIVDGCKFPGAGVVPNERNGRDQLAFTICNI